MINQEPPENKTPGENRHEDDRTGSRYDRRERRQHQPLRGLFWGLLLITLGILFLAEKQGWVPSATWWQYLLIGIGGCFILDGLVNLAIVQPHHEIASKFIPGIILVCIGLAFVFGFDRWWPLALIAAGVIILLSVFIRHRQ
jgi:hypothetical protein